MPITVDYPFDAELLMELVFELIVLSTEGEVVGLMKLVF